MPAAAKPARLWLRPATNLEPSTWIIKDRGSSRRTGCSEFDLEGAQGKLREYLEEKRAKNHDTGRGKDRDPSQILVADVLNIYSADKAKKHARPVETAGRVLRLQSFFGDKLLSEVNGSSCRAYVEFRGSEAAARRELEDLRSAINFHRKEGHCSSIVGVALPDKSIGRDRWLTRSEVAKLIWAAWRYREVQKGVTTDKHPRRHVAKFILVGFYTGTRSSAICGGAFAPTVGAGRIDLEQGVFHRRAEGSRVTKKRQPPVRLPDRLLPHLRRWEAKGQRYAVEWNRAPVRSVKKAFAATVKLAGLGPDVTPHTLRHTAATWLMQAGVPIWEAAGFLGMTVETLERFYGHQHAEFQKAAANAFQRPAAPVPHRIGGTKVDLPRQNTSKVVDFPRL